MCLRMNHRCNGLLKQHVEPASHILFCSSYAEQCSVVRTVWQRHKMIEHMLSVRLGRFMERSGVLPTRPFAYRIGLSTCFVLLIVCVQYNAKCVREWVGG